MEMICLKNTFCGQRQTKPAEQWSVEAALEIAKASVGATTAYSGIKTQQDLRNVASEIDALADAIQEALEGGEEE